MNCTQAGRGTGVRIGMIGGVIGVGVGVNIAHHRRWPNRLIP